MATCFVIMPFGEKKDAEGKIIDFDDIYTYLIKEGVEKIKGLPGFRSEAQRA
jgi:hypothetical protein